MDYGFANYEIHELSVPEGVQLAAEVSLGKEEVCTGVCPLPEKIVIPRGLGESVVVEAAVSDSLEAPVAEGQVFGEVAVYVNSELYGSYPVAASVAVEKLDFSTCFTRLMQSLCGVSA